MFSNNTNPRWARWGLATLLLLSGCAIPPQEAETPGNDNDVNAQEESAIPVETAPPTFAEQVETASTTSGANMDNAPLVARRFSEGVALYNDGKYANAIRVFREPVFERAWPELRVRALRYLAFSYCVTEQLPQCRKSFVEILKLQPDFTLTAAERSHPIWGPVFTQVQKDQKEQK